MFKILRAFSPIMPEGIVSSGMLLFSWRPKGDCWKGNLYKMGFRLLSEEAQQDIGYTYNFSEL